MAATDTVTVLGFAHLPLEAGGKQTSGLGYAAYAVAKELNRTPRKLEYLLCCTDVSSPPTSVLELQSGIQAVGWSIQGLLFFGARNPALALRLALRAVEYCLRYRYERNPIRVFAHLLLYAATIQHHGPSILHIHGADRTVLLSRVPGARQRSWVTTMHGVIGFDKNLPRACHAIERDALQVGQHFVFVTTGTRDQLVSGYDWTPKHVARVIPNGLDTDVFVLMDRMECRTELRLPIDKTIFLTAGSFSPHKGQELILRSLAGLPADVQSTICCVFVGKGTTRLLVSQKPQPLEVHVQEHVPVERLVRYYNAADYHLSASSSEGFGMVMTESLACGTPIVLPKRCDIIGEGFVLDGRNAIVYPDVSAPAIRQAVIRALNTCFDRAVTRQAVEGLSWTRVASLYEGLFLSLSRRSSTYRPLWPADSSSPAGQENTPLKERGLGLTEGDVRSGPPERAWNL